MNYGGAHKFFYKKSFYNSNVFIEIKTYFYKFQVLYFTRNKNLTYRNKNLLLFSDEIIQTNKFFIFRYLLKLVSAIFSKFLIHLI